jgi:Tol biopolymer transport system component
MIKHAYPILLALALTACSIEVTGITPAATVPGAPSSLESPVPSTTALHTAATNAGTPGVEPTGLPPDSTGGFVIPVTWGDLGLSGKIVFTAGRQGVDELDLSTGQVTRMFRTPDPEMSWVIGQSVSPDGREMVMAFAPPPPPGQTQTGYTDLVIVPTDGSAEPEPLVERKDPDEDFIWPTWSPDGKFVYYVHISPPEENSFLSHFVIERLPYPDRQPEAIVENAIWPRLSSDGSRLAYVVYDTVTAAQSLYTANADGTDARHIELPSSFISIDSPMFSPDNEWILFSGITQGFSDAPSPSWLDRLLGVQAAFANGAPADWWRIPVDGGNPEKLTSILDLGMYGTFAPDGRHVAYSSYTGLFVMNPDGSDIVQLLGIENIPGTIGQATVDWLP